jgi:hypothetical protein
MAAAAFEALNNKNFNRYNEPCASKQTQHTLAAIYSINT